MTTVGPAIGKSKSGGGIVSLTAIVLAKAV
jgi:hypothetical protein